MHFDSTKDLRRERVFEGVLMENYYDILGARPDDEGEKKAYPVDSGGATCCALNDRIRPVAGTTIDGQRAFAFAISESVF